MAVVSVKSTAIGNRDASPPVITDAIKIQAVKKEAAGVCEVASTDSVGSKYFFAQVPSNARISQVLVSCDDLGTTGTMDIGLYKSTKDGGTVVDVDFFGAAVDMKAAALKDSNITYTGAYNIDKIDKFLWEVLGLSSDPQIMYDIVGTLTEVSSAGGTVALKAEYVL